MSKCQAKKYLAGGRCGGESGVKGGSGGVAATADFNALLAARAQQDAVWSTAVTTPTKSIESPSNTQLVVKQGQEGKLSRDQKKKKDIDFILSGDYEF